jgi:hypothetical protein
MLQNNVQNLPPMYNKPFEIHNFTVQIEVVAVYTVDDDGWTSMLVFGPAV